MHLIDDRVKLDFQDLTEEVTGMFEKLTLRPKKCNNPDQDYFF